MIKILCKDKDGGPDSTVWAYWLIEWKAGFSIALLKFVGESRDCYHSHAFNSCSWVIKGAGLLESILGSKKRNIYTKSFNPIITYKNTFHRVDSAGTTWVITFRGPWDKSWEEYIQKLGKYKLTHGREVVNDKNSHY